MNSVVFVVTSIWLGVLAGAYVIVRAAAERRTVRRRLFDDPTMATAELAEPERRGIARWLFLAGLRSSAALPTFLGVTLLLLLGGLAFALTLLQLGTIDSLVALLAIVPGGVGEVFIPFALAAPWLSMLFLALLPSVYVRGLRRRRVRMVEEDLPLLLDLLSTLAQAGLGFDAALDRVLDAQREGRPLAEELRSFQVDVLAGRRRIDALRRLSRRVEVTWFGIFISALVQTEQVGAGLSETLRTQAADLRNRRRERALELAASLPVKLTVPLVICYLPGLMTVAIGPNLFELFQVLDRVIRDAGL